MEWLIGITILVVLFIIIANNRHKTPRKRQVRPATVSGFSYMQEEITTSRDFYRFLLAMSKSTRCQKVLNELNGADEAIKVLGHVTINSKLALIVLFDIVDCLAHLGYSTKNLTKRHATGVTTLISLIMGKTVRTSEDIDQLIPGAIAVLEIIEDSSFTINKHTGEYRFPALFGGESNEHDLVQRYATHLYRFASLIAKADGRITRQEKETLTEIFQIMNACKSTGKKSQSETTGEYKTLEDALQKLNELTGLESIKKEVHSLIDFITIQNKRKSVGLKETPISYHCVFTGNPGTGKTTVARIIAEIYKGMGILKKGHLVETDRSGLVAEYVGKTAVKTNEIIDRALDGVLFIDEAYSLIMGGKEDYGSEAIATLLKRMEDDRDRLVVIIAGYTKEIKDFINSNPGLQSRFTRYFEFPDYTAEELAEIFRSIAKKSQYVCNRDVEENLVQIMEYGLSQKDSNFGNARYVRNLFEQAIQRQAVRLSSVVPITSEMLSELTLHDLGFSK